MYHSADSKTGLLHEHGISRMVGQCACPTSMLLRGAVQALSTFGPSVTHGTM